MFTHHFDYSTTLSNIGCAKHRTQCPFPVLIRPIPGSDLFDGLLPWPYIQLTDLNELEQLVNHHPSLVTITGIAAPSSSADLAMENHRYVQRYKDHFVYDPRLPLILGARTRRHIKNGHKLNSAFNDAKDHPSLAGDIANIYSQFLKRKNLPGNFFQFTQNHFELFCKADCAKIFTTQDSQSNLSAAALGYLDGGSLHLVHIIISDLGLKNDAGYVLMSKIIDFAMTNNLLVFMGAMPSQKTGGLYRFKKRWSNRLMESYLLKMIVRSEPYLQLCGENPVEDFFPPYRKTP